MGATDSPFTVVIIMTRDTHACKLLLKRGRAASKVTATNENIGSLWPESGVGPTLRAPLSGTFLRRKGCRKPVLGVWVGPFSIRHHSRPKPLSAECVMSALCRTSWARIFPVQLEGWSCSSSILFD